MTMSNRFEVRRSPEFTARHRPGCPCCEKDPLTDVLDTASQPVIPPTARTEPSATGAIRALGSNPATAPIVLHPGDSISARRRVLYIVLLGALTALGPFTIDLYLPAFPVLEADFQTSAAAIQLTLTGTMIGFALGQLIVGPLSDKVGRRIPLLAVTALHVAAQQRDLAHQPSRMATSGAETCCSPVSASRWY